MAATRAHPVPAPRPISKRTEWSVTSLSVVETVDLPENLSITLANSLGLAFRTYYLTPRLQSPAAGVRAWTDSVNGRTEYSWPVPARRPDQRAPPGNIALVDAHVIITPSDVKIEFTSPRPIEDFWQEALAGITDDIRAFVTAFLEYAKRSSLYVAVPPYPRSAAEKRTPTRSGSEVLRRIFSGNSTNVFLLVVVLSFPALLFLGDLGLIVMVGAQAVALYYSDRIVLRSGSVAPSAERPRVAVVGIMPRKDLLSSGSIARRPPLPVLRAELEDAIVEAEATGASARAMAAKALDRAGVHCSEEDLEITSRDVYGMVESAAHRFGLPVPKVVIAESPISNAAATGVSPGHASIVITAGSLEVLNDRQLEAIIGHELGHIRGRDSVILMSTTVVLWFGAIFLWPSVLQYLGLAYFVLVFALIFLIGKVLETRADTFSAFVLGEAGNLASALTSIAFTELYREERSHPLRFISWLAPDPHPPMYFRVKRLVNIESRGLRSRHALLISVRDCLAGFFGALVRR